MDSPSFYTPNDDLYQLESALQCCRCALSTLKLLSLPAFADLEECARTASAAGHAPFAEIIWHVFALLEYHDKSNVVAHSAQIRPARPLWLLVHRVLGTFNVVTILCGGVTTGQARAAIRAGSVFPFLLLISFSNYPRPPQLSQSPTKLLSADRLNEAH